MELMLFPMLISRHFRFFQDSLVMGTDAILFFFDLSRYVSFLNLDEWIEFLGNTALDWSKMPKLLIGTKSELEESKGFDDDQAIEFMNTHKLLGYGKTSSVTGDGVIEVFSEVLRNFMDQA